MAPMINVLRFICEWIRVLIKILGPGGVKAVAAENAVLRQQLITISRTMKRSPSLTTSDRIIFGMLGSWINPRRLSRVSILLKPATILKFHKALVERKYRRLFSNKNARKPGPKGPSDDLINAIIEMKKRNPRYGYLRIAMQIYHAFGIIIDKGVVKRILDKHYKPTVPIDTGPSWLTFIGHAKDSLWSLDFFRCESILLKTHWVMVVMDQYTRSIIGFSVHQSDLDGVAVCCMFNRIISGKKQLPKYLSSDNDPLFKFHRWQANLRVLDVEEIKSVPHSPTSHPFVERIIGSARREYLNHLLFWNERDLQRKLDQFQIYYNSSRGHSSLESKTPTEMYDQSSSNVVSIKNYRWKLHARNLFQLPVAA